MTLHAREWKELYPQFFKPKGCPVRKAEPRGPLKVCEDICQFFEACVKLTQNERRDL